MYLVQIGAPVTHKIISSNQFTCCIFFLGIGWTSSGWKKNNGAAIGGMIWGSMCTYAKWMSSLENNLWLNI